MADIKKVNVQGTIYNIMPDKLANTNVAYGTCTTAAATAAKVVTVVTNTDWKLVAGSTITVKFSYTNTASNPTLNVNNTGAKSIYYNTSIITTSSLAYAGYANRFITYVYDGTNYVWAGWSIDVDTNTDTKVTQTVRTTNGEFPILLRGTSAGTTTTTTETTFASGVTVNPSSGKITASNYSGGASLSGTPTAPTASAETNSTQIATTAYVTTAINNVLQASNAMVFKGTIGTGGTVTALPASHQVGDVYVVSTAGSFAGQTCEIGDMLVCTTTGTASKDSDWTVVQSNINGAVTGPSNAVASNVAIFNGSTGKVIKDSGFTIGKSVPSDAKFTDTHYVSKNVVGSSTATSNTSSALTNGNVYLNSVENGAVTSSHKISGSGATTVTTDSSGNIVISSTDNNTVYTHPSYTARTGVPTANQTPAFGGTFSVSQPVSDAKGHITAINSRTITIPSATATTSANGLMSSSDKTKLNGVHTSAVNVVVSSTQPTNQSTGDLWYKVIS